MERYTYEGPVVNYNKVVDNNWKCETYAKSPKKAKANMMYQYRITHGLVKNTKIFLPFELEVG